jgi:hypothetical protein
VKEHGEFYSGDGLKVTDYDFNLDLYILKLSKVIFPLDPNRQAELVDLT